MYIPDGSKSDYGKERSNCFSWGWLSSEHPYTTGWDKKLKISFIEGLVQLPVVDLYRGCHTDIGLGVGLGATPCNGSLKFSIDGIIYVAPVAVVYYIEILDYLPPLEVRDALDKFVEGWWNR
jgi:hypothetical protein